MKFKGKDFRMKKVCVIGGSGFLGSHVADALSDEGFHVRIYDRAPSPWLTHNQEMIVGDLLDEDLLESAISGSDIVYNFAALADLNEALIKPVESIRINILGNCHVLEACRRNAVKRFVYASTVYVHSRDGGFYRCSKQSAEHFVEEYQNSYGLDFTILRYGSLYGPRADSSNGLLRVVKNALECGEIRYEGSRDTFREYIHVLDAAQASVAALGEDFINQSIVLTGQEPMRVLDLLEMLREILGENLPINFIEGGKAGHYIRTPYAYQSKLGRKYVLPMHIDLGQGLLQLIENVRKENPNLMWPK
jgi:UDP-glucose 4-epimerase